MLLFYTTVSTILKQSHLGLVLALRTKAQKDTLLGSLPLTLVSLCLSLSISVSCIVFAARFRFVQGALGQKFFAWHLKNLQSALSRLPLGSPSSPLLPCVYFLLQLRLAMKCKLQRKVCVGHASVFPPLPADGDTPTRFLVSRLLLICHTTKKRAGKAPTKQVTCSYSN